MATPAPSVVDIGVPSAKLPLAARKSLRDKWESERPKMEEKISNLLGVPWSCPVDYGLFWDKIPEGTDMPKANPGGTVYEYISDFVRKLEAYVKKNGQQGVNELNRVAHSHAVIMALATSPDIKRWGTEILSDGIFRIVHTPGNIGINVSNASEDIAGAVSKAAESADKASGSASALDFIAKANIAQVWDAKVGALNEAFKKILDTPVITLSPNFEENAAKLEAYVKANPGTSSPRDDWKPRIGEWTWEYFEGARKKLISLKFDKDDMLQEGFKEAVDKNEISFRVVDKLKKGSGYNETVIENGVWVMQVTPQTWISNINNIGDEVVDLL